MKSLSIKLPTTSAKQDSFSMSSLKTQQDMGFKTSSLSLPKFDTKISVSTRNVFAPTLRTKGMDLYGVSSKQSNLSLGSLSVSNFKTSLMPLSSMNTGVSSLQGVQSITSPFVDLVEITSLKPININNNRRIADIGLTSPSIRGFFDMPTLGGYADRTPKKRRRKTGSFEIAPGFTSIIAGTKQKGLLKVSKTFGVTPFQTRGIGKRGKAYYQLTDL